MISSVPREKRAFANSSAQFFLNLLGFLPAPFVYGFVCKLTGGRSSLWGMACLTLWSLFGLANIFVAFVLDKEKRGFVKGELEIPILEKEKLSSISEGSESPKNKNNGETGGGFIENKSNYVQITEKKEEIRLPVLKKKTSLLQVSYINSILIPLNIPKVKFAHGKRKELNKSYDEKREIRENVNGKRLTASQVLEDNRNETSNRLKSSSMHYEHNTELS